MGATPIAKVMESFFFALAEKKISNFCWEYRETETGSGHPVLPWAFEVLLMVPRVTG